MTSLGTAAVAIWWSAADDRACEFHEWHSKQRLPARLGGFNRGSRWQRGVFVIDERP